MDKAIEIFAASFNHCSTICSHQDGVLIAWYSGSNECHDDQSVHIIFISPSKRSDIIRIGDRTGNPVLWNHNNTTTLLWSKFEDDGPINRTVDRWKYCSLWTQTIEMQNKPILKNRPECVIQSDKHLLGRCPPIIKNGQVILPLYDELEGNCVIADGSTFNELSRFGVGMIQPTIWAKHNKIHSISRNFRTKKKHAYYSSSADGTLWEEPQHTKISNVNNSVCVANWNRATAIIWNNTFLPYRNLLTLGLLNNQQPLSAVPISVLGERYGAYPYCAVINNKLHITFTNSSKKIEYHVWEWERLRETYRRNLIGSS